MSCGHVSRAQVARPLRLAVVVVLGVTLIAFTDSSSGSGVRPWRPEIRKEPVTIVGLTPLSVERVTYEPGTSRDWAADEHIVAVAVVAGRLAVYGPAGERHVYGSGEGYVAGWWGHRTANESEDPVETFVTRHARPQKAAE